MAWAALVAHLGYGAGVNLVGEDTGWLVDVEALHGDID